MLCEELNNIYAQCSLPWLLLKISMQLLMCLSLRNPSLIAWLPLMLSLSTGMHYVYKKGCIKHVETNKMVEKLFHASLIRK